MTSSEQANRPPLDRELSADEFRRWYWLKEELATFARLLGVSASGYKPAIADRIHAVLAGDPVPAATKSRARAPRIEGPITRATVIPEGQTASQQLRPFFVAEIGSGFRYDWFMRTFLAESAGATLGDAVDHWHATREMKPPETPEQLEFVRFTKAWHLAHPDGSAELCRAAWKIHRSLPVDQRPRPEASD